MSTTSLFDLGESPPQAPQSEQPHGRAGAAKEAAPDAHDDGEGTRWTRCGRWRAGCRNRVDGRDPTRTCATCRAAGAPARVPWEEAKPDGLGSDGVSVVDLANAGLIDEKPVDLSPATAELLAAVDAKTAELVKANHGANVLELRRRAWAIVEAGEPEPQFGVFPCGHPRTSPPPFGFCGACSRSRL